MFSGVGQFRHMGARGGAGVVFPLAGSELDLDFTTDRAVRNGVPSSATSLLTVSRTGTAYVDDVSGNWVSVGANLPRMSNKGLLIEEVRTNALRNNSMQGAVVGSPGTLPTNWTFANISGLTSQIVAVGTDSGIDYIDIRFSGTSSGNIIAINPEASTAIAALQNDTWDTSFFAKYVGGSLTNVGNVKATQLERDSGAAVLAQGSGTAGSLTSTWQRFLYDRTLSAALTAFISLRIDVSITSGAPVDVTIRFGWPQVEKGPFITSPIRTTGVAVARPSDVIDLVSNVMDDPAFTLYAEFSLDYFATSKFPGIFGGQNVDSTNRSALYYSGSALTCSCATVDANVTQADTAVAGTISLGTVNKLAARVSPNDFRVARAGALSAQDTSGTVPALIKTCLGRLSGSSNFLEGYLRRATYFPSAMSDAQLQALTA